MRRTVLILLLLVIGGMMIYTERSERAAVSSSTSLVTGPPQSGDAFSEEGLRTFVALEPIDTHAHVFVESADLNGLLRKLHMHILDICVIDDHSEFEKTLQPQLNDALQAVHASSGHASLCTTFSPFGFNQTGFADAAIRQINDDFEHGAIAVKIWKNIGMELQDSKGNYILPDDPVFEPIYRDIAAHHKTLLAHVADPDSLWEPPNRASPDYSYYMEHPEWYMYGKPHPASKQAILRARDHVLEQNPGLRVVGAHLGSMEGDFDEIGRHLDRYPNFAVDLAARMPYVMAAPRAKMIAFFTKYQNRLTYGTDLGLHPGQDPAKAVKEWEQTYARDWRFFSTSEMVEAENHQKVQGLSLSQPVLHNLYHDNAVRWFPGIVADSH